MPGASQAQIDAFARTQTVNRAGGTAIDGVPGTAAPVTLKFRDVVGGATGALLPTGTLREEIDGTLHEQLARRTLKDLATAEAPASAAPQEPQPAATTAGPEETSG